MKWRIFTAFTLVIMLVALPAYAAVDNSGVMDNVIARYATAAAAWSGTIISAATKLFWTLVTISMVWTFAIMALRRAELTEFFAEFVRFVVVTGFFFWLLQNGPTFATAIYDSLRDLAGTAAGTGPKIWPSSIVDIGFEIFGIVVDKSSVLKPVDSAVGMIIAAIIMVILALISVNMLLLLCAGWILAFGGVFFLGFGGSRWTSDIAINFYRTALGLATQLMTMVLIVGIGKTFLDDYYVQMSDAVTIKEMGVMLVVAIILFMLVNKVPAMIAGVVTGASINHSGIGMFGAGAAVGPAAMAIGAAAIAGSAMRSGGQAVYAAITNANQNAATEAAGMIGSGSASAIAGSAGNGTGAASGSPTGPFARAAGLTSNSPSGGGIAAAQQARAQSTQAASQAPGGVLSAAGRVSTAAQSSNQVAQHATTSASTANSKAVDAAAEVAAFRDRSNPPA